MGSRAEDRWKANNTRRTIPVCGWCGAVKRAHAERTMECPGHHKTRWRQA